MVQRLDSDRFILRAVLGVFGRIGETTGVSNVFFLFVFLWASPCFLFFLFFHNAFPSHSTESRSSNLSPRIKSALPRELSHTILVGSGGPTKVRSSIGAAQVHNYPYKIGPTPYTVGRYHNASTQ
ncbi:hypothetical protein LY78DRAFT_235320 [Colletotrichum sublineola]|nr:hypothetical protein LY78DRAFT_235320 [Colletotrichum sublineola]